MGVMPPFQNKEEYEDKVINTMVPAVGVEPTRAEAHRILSPARLPFHHAGILADNQGQIVNSKKIRLLIINFIKHINPYSSW